MLDVNEDQLSSESNGADRQEENEVNTSKPNEKDDSAAEQQQEKLQAPGAEGQEDVKSKKEPVEEVALPNAEATEVVKDVDKEIKSEENEASETISEVAQNKEEASVSDAIEDKKKGEDADLSKEEEASEKNDEKNQVEKEPQVIKKELPEFDLSVLSLEGIVKLTKKLLDEFEIQEVKNQIESLNTGFQKKFKALLAEKKEEFVKTGGEAEDFFHSEPLKHKFDELLSDYKRKRQQFYRDLERFQKENLELRLKLIDELKSLIDNAEASTMYKNFRNLEDRWRSVGQIPRAKYNDVWRTYHHHVERFYDLLHLNNDFRDLDFKHNLEEKSKLIEKAEALAIQDDVNHAFKELQILHRMWKEDIGPVARELREEVWHKFSEATKKIHKKRHEYQEILDEKYKANVGLKLAVIDKIKAIDPSKNLNHKDWQQSIKKLEALREEFFAIGKVPRSKNEQIWQLFREATRSFNAEKNKFYKGIKKDQSENLKKKMALIEQAESLKESEDWVMATEVYKKIQSEWKKIGHVPRRDSDKIWKQFKDACNHYFDRLHNKQNDLDKDQSAVIEKKKSFMDSLRKEIDKDKELTLEFVQKSLEEWRALGVLPSKVKHLDIKFNKVLDSAYKKLNIDKDEASFLRFKSTVDAMLDQKNSRKLDSEQLFIRRKIDEITKEIKQLENNISFISNASEDNPLVRNVYKNIESYKKSLSSWKRKIDYMKKMEY